MKKSTLRIIFLSPHNPHDIGTWSGTAYSAYHALVREGATVEIVRANWSEWLLKLVSRLLRRFGIKTDYSRSIAYAYLTSKEASVRLLLTRGDVILAFAASTYLYALKTARPIVSVTDATFACIREIYPYFSEMPAWLQADADRIERNAFARSALAILSSDWAKASAIKDYGVEPALISVLPFGPNIDSTVVDQYRTTKSGRFADGVRLLFIGADWDRKGGPLLLDIKQDLETRGVRAEIYLVGNSPSHLHCGDGIHVFGRLDKANDRQLQKLCELYELAHFFVLPTTAEAYGIVFSEAQAFGCPSLTYAVGGTPTAVLNTVTGHTLPLTAGATDFADKIMALVRDPGQYEEMSRNCRGRYETAANWSTWAAAVMNGSRRLTKATAPFTNR